MAGTTLRTRGERLRAARLKYFRSARLAAIALRMPVSTYGAHERAQARGGRDYGPEEATRFGRRFGVMPEWLLTGWCPPQQERDGETTVRLHEEDYALSSARATGHSASELVRKGLRVVASRYYKRRRPPSTLLFESTDTKLGDESELFRDLER